MIDKYKLFSGLLFGSLWIMLCQGFVCDFLPNRGGALQSVALLVTDLAFLLLGVFSVRSKHDICMLGSFVLLLIISEYLNDEPALVLANGFRDYIGLLFAIPTIRFLLRSKYAEDFVKSFDRQLEILLYLQAPCITLQFLLYGAGDPGGGTLGLGGSGMVSVLIYVISFYFVNKKWDAELSYKQNLIANRKYIFLLYPTFLNETKISFIFLVAYFILLLKVDRKFILRLALASPVVAVLALALGYVYMNVTQQDSDEVLTVEFFRDYLVGEDIREMAETAMKLEDQGLMDVESVFMVDLPRIGRLVFIPEILEDAGGGTMFGACVGQFKGGSVFDVTPFYRKYYWLLKGSQTMLMMLLVEIGVLGLIWFLVDVISAIYTPNSLQRAPNIRLYLLLTVFATLPYNPMFRYYYVCFIIFYIAMWGLQPKQSQLPEENSH